MASHEEAAQAFRQISSDGDVYDAAKLKWGPAALTPYVAIASYNALYGLESGIAGPEDSATTTTLGLAALWGVSKGISNYRSARAAERADIRQEVIRQYLDEPVDIIRPDHGKDRSLTMRWYGSDGIDETEDRYGLAARLTRLARFAHMHDVPRLAFGVHFVVRDPDNSPVWDSEKFGDIQHGRRIVSKKAKTYGRGLLDDAGDDTIAVCTPEQAINLAEYIRSGETQGSLLTKLIARLDDEHVSARYQEYLDGRLEKDMFATLLRGVVTQALEKDAYPTLEMCRSGQTGQIERKKGWPSYRVGPAGLAQMMTAFSHARTQDPTVRYEGEVSLVSLAGQEDYVGLIEHVTDEESEASSKDIAIAAYLTVLDEKEVTTTNPVSKADSQRNTRRTLYGALSGTLSVHPFRRDKALRQLQKSDKRWPMRKSGATVMALAFGGLQGFLAVEAQDSVVTQIEADYREYADLKQTEPINADAMATYIRDDAPDLTRRFMQGRKAVKGMFLEAQQWPLNNWSLPEAGPVISAAEQTLGGDRLTGTRGRQSWFGDVNPGSRDRTVLHVEPLAGEDTAGYWQSFSTSNIVFTRSEYEGSIFRDYEIGMKANGSFSDALEFSSPSVEEVMAQKPDFAVHLEVQAQEYVAEQTILPYKRGYSVIGWQVANEDPTLSTGELQSGGRFVIQRAAGSDAMESGPVRITYWLKKTPETQTDGKKSLHPMHWGATGGEIWLTNAPSNTYLMSIPQVSRDTKAALGLEPGASDKEVLAAIKSKNYAKAPFTDAGIKDVQVSLTPGSLDPARALGIIGATTAKLDSLNCNLASLAMVLATGGEYEGKTVNMASGYYDNGDGIITETEAHAYLVDTEGAVLDPTPASYLETRNISQVTGGHETLGSAENMLRIGGLSLAALAGAGLGYAGRRPVARGYRQVQMVRATTGDSSARAASILTDGLYGNPASPLGRSGTIAAADIRTYVTENLPQDMNLAAFKSQLSEQRLREYAKLPLRERMAVRRLLRSLRTIAGDASR